MHPGCSPRPGSALLQHLPSRTNCMPASAKAVSNGGILAALGRLPNNTADAAACQRSLLWHTNPVSPPKFQCSYPVPFPFVLFSFRWAAKAVCLVMQKKCQWRKPFAPQQFVLWREAVLFLPGSRDSPRNKPSGGESLLYPSHVTSTLPCAKIGLWPQISPRTKVLSGKTVRYYRSSTVISSGMGRKLRCSARVGTAKPGDRSSLSAATHCCERRLQG